MRYLPAITCGPNRWVLPMADRSAAFLAELLLADCRAELAASLSDLLEGDPPLTLWTFYWASRLNRLQARSVHELAAWLAEHALDVLQWPHDGRSSLEAADAAVERFTACATKSLATAQLAARLAAPQGPAIARAALLAGLVHNAPDWFCLAAADGSSALPEEFSEPSAWVPEEGRVWVTRARNILDGCLRIGEGEAPAEPLRDATERRPHTARQEPRPPGVMQAPLTGLGTTTEPDSEVTDGQCEAWAASFPGVCLRLPALAARLARLEQLESRFHQTLQREKLDAMAELAAGAGHEINNPLAIIAGRAQLLLKDETDAQRRRELAVITAQVARAHEMIADLRLFARPPRPEYEKLDLVALVDRAVAELAGDAAERGTSIMRAGGMVPVMVEADPTQLTVALQAILRNALEAIDHGGHVGVALDAGEQTVAIRVSDDGPGITPEDRRHIFDPFFSARQAGRGLGMGLSKSWRIVTNHGGRIDVESQAGQGTVFTIILPRRRTVA